jgi:hypothetical protein
VGGLASSGIHSGIIVCGRLDPCLPPFLAPPLCQFPRAGLIFPQIQREPSLSGARSEREGPKVD